MDTKYKIEHKNSSIFILDTSGSIVDELDDLEAATRSANLLNYAYNQGRAKPRKPLVEYIVSISAVLIALISLVVAINQADQTEKHNKLSVRPKLEFVLSLGPKIRKLELMNIGLGPAIITSFNVTVEGGIDGVPSVKHLGIALNKLVEEKVWRHGYFQENKAIKASDEKHLIFQQNLDGWSQEKIDKLDAALKRISIEVEYESFYGEKIESAKI